MLIISISLHNQRFTDLYQTAGYEIDFIFKHKIH